MTDAEKLQEAIALFEAGRKYSKSGTIKINLNEDGYDVVLSALRDKLESPRPDWTPCAEGLPTPDAEENGVRKRYLCTTSTPSGKFVVVELIYITIGEKPVWYDNDYYELFEGSGYQVTAWMPRPDPYNPDHIRGTTKKIDHIVDVNKKIEQEERQ